MNSTIIRTTLIFLGALFAPLALGQLDPFHKDDAGKGAPAAAKAPLDPVAGGGGGERGRSRIGGERGGEAPAPPRGPASSRNWVA